MTYNVRVATENDKERTGRDRRWPTRRELLIKHIKEIAPDILGIQEAGPDQVPALRKALQAAGYTVEHVFREGHGKGGDEGLMVCTRDSTAIVCDTGSFFLATDTPSVVGSKAPGAEYPRVAVWAECRLGADGPRLLFVNMHLDHPTTEQAELNRVRSAKQILEFVGHARWKGHAVVVVGDSNAEPGALAHRAFVESGVLTDSWAECHGVATARPPTFHNYEGGAFEPPSKWAQTAWPQSLSPPGAAQKSCHIDWVLHTAGLSAETCEIDHKEEDGIWPSDHFAVVATLTQRASKPW